MNSKNLSDFKIKKSKLGKLSVFYKDKQLLVISEKVLFSAILEASPSWFLKSLSSLVGTPEVKIDSGLVKFASVYAFEKLKFYKKNVETINDVSVLASAKKSLVDTKTKKSFIEAMRIMNDNGEKDISTFIKAQIDGLKFVNNGLGTFPSPSQLASEHALTRLLQFNSSTTKGEKELKPERYWHFDEKTDGDIALQNNPKYQEAIVKIKNGTAKLNAALYAKKCYSRRRNGNTYSLIEEYINQISD